MSYWPLPSKMLLPGSVGRAQIRLGVGDGSEAGLQVLGDEIVAQDGPGAAPDNHAGTVLQNAVVAHNRRRALVDGEAKAGFLEQVIDDGGLEVPKTEMPLAPFL
jgi:hypothetical protein